MNKPPSISSVACFDGTTQRFIYISLLGTSYVSDLFEDLVGNNALSSQRTVIDVLRFIYFYSFIYFLSFSGFVSRRCAHVGWFIRRAVVSEDKFHSTMTRWTPQSHYKTEFGTCQNPFFSLTVSIFFLFFFVSDHFFSPFLYSFKPQIDFCIPVLASAASLQTVSWFVPNYTVVCVYKGAIVSIFNMRKISLS